MRGRALRAPIHIKAPAIRKRQPSIVTQLLATVSFSFLIQMPARGPLRQYPATQLLFEALLDAFVEHLQTRVERSVEQLNGR